MYRQPLDREDKDLAVGGSFLYLADGRAQPPLSGLMSSMAAALALARLNRGSSGAVMVPPDPLFGGGFF